METALTKDMDSHSLMPFADSSFCGIQSMNELNVELGRAERLPDFWRN